MYLLYFNIYTKILLTRLHDKKVITQTICDLWTKINKKKHGRKDTDEKTWKTFVYENNIYTEKCKYEHQNVNNKIIDYMRIWISKCGHGH